jgi:hypothetical protein
MTFCLLVLLVSPSNPAPTSFTNGTSSCATPTQGEAALGPVCPATTPTWYSPPSGESFLGNLGFYMGIPGEPALYETVSGETVTLEFTNIEVSDSSGSPASGWELVTGDAESTDPNESLSWSTCAPPTTGTYAGTVSYSTASSCTSSSSNPPFSLLPNTPNPQDADDYIGNACPYPTGAPASTAFSGRWLTGINVTNATLNGSTVECAASGSSDKTGTVMLDAQTPHTLTVTMVGGGLQAIFLGLMLP